MSLLDYAEVTASVNVTHTEAAADTILTGSPLSFDGATRVRVEFYAQVIELPNSGYDLNVGLWDNGTLARLLVGLYSKAASTLDVTGYGLCYLTPSAGSHTFSVRAYRSPGSSGAAIVAAGDGVGDNFPPAFYTVSVA